MKKMMTGLLLAGGLWSAQAADMTPAVPTLADKGAVAAAKQYVPQVSYSGNLVLRIPLSLDPIPGGLELEASGYTYNDFRYMIYCILYDENGTPLASHDRAIESGQYVYTAEFSEEQLSQVKAMKVDFYVCRVDMLGHKKGSDSAIAVLRFHPEPNGSQEGYTQSDFVESVQGEARGTVQ